MSLTGYLDIVENGRIVGWARDRDRPQRCVEVLLWIDGRLVARALANRIRADLASAGVGDGRYGFEFADPIPAAARAIRVTTVDGDDLRGSPRQAPDWGGWRSADPRSTVTVLAIARNEAPYIEEWIAHHVAIGVDRFIVYDNASTDGTGERLRGNPRLAGLVDVVDWPASSYPATEGPQLHAYTDALPELRRRGGWVAVIDIDEFIVPLVDDGLPAMLARFVDVPALSLCWRVFGSAGHADRDDDRLVTERFRFAGPGTLVKSIARADAVQSFAIHAPWLHAGVAVDELRRPIERRATSRSPTYRWGQINHYFGKSWAEWEAKRDRGRAGPAAGSARWQRPDSHFHGMDAASEHDLAIQRFYPAMLRALQRLFPERALRAKNARSRAASPSPRAVALWPGRIDGDMRRRSTAPARGAIDHPPANNRPARASAGKPVRFAGWLFVENGETTNARLLRLRPIDPTIAGDYVTTIHGSRARPDVARHFANLPESIVARCGFDIAVDLKALPRGPYRADLGVVLADGVAWTAVALQVEIA